MSVYGHQFAVVFKNTNTSAMKALRVLIAWSLASGVFRVYAIVFVQEPSYFPAVPSRRAAEGWPTRYTWILDESSPPGSPTMSVFLDQAVALRSTSGSCHRGVPGT